MQNKLDGEKFEEGERGWSREQSGRVVKWREAMGRSYVEDWEGEGEGEQNGNREGSRRTEKWEGRK